MLGHLEITKEDAPVIVTAPKQRIALTALLLQANQLVTRDALVEHIWESRLPSDVYGSLHTHMSRLRQALGDGDTLITSRDSGYCVLAGPDTLDVLRFRHLTALADEARKRGDTARESRLLREALALWRGPALAGIDSGPLQRDVVPVLERERLRAQERWFEVEIGRGRPAEVIANLEAAVRAHPTHESFWAQLIVAHSQAGRPAEARAAYRAARSLLSAELGADPGPEIQEAYQHLREGGVAARTAQRFGGVPAPAELPADNDAFTGRAAELGRLRAQMTSGGRRPVVAIVGAAGIGKSALAIQAAHQIAGHFPGGQLYVDLYGATPGVEPLRPLEVLRRFLRSWGLAEAAIPGSVDEAAARFRSLTYDSRVLVVLDNARDAAQVRPLIPGGPGCGVVITSRRSLVPLVGIGQTRLGALSQEESSLLLSRLLGRARVGAEPEAAAEVARLCDGLPAELCFAAARLAARPAETLAAIRDRVAMERNRPAEYAAG
ncbi:BTAD domain-containing putative transcriptional regulator [Nonomuraea sp. NPDC046802]|uniref:AfsR/SARP family transcriptional regulator n=1 Tax=Nonomuraea sp. NPDC046802 TaxID=3154919 RepID=UPI0033E15D0D